MKYAYASHIEASYTGPFDSIEDALKEAFAEYPDLDEVYAGEISFPDPVSLIDADGLIDDICNYEDFSHDWAEDWPDASKEQKKELTDSLRAVFKAWLDKHKLHPTFWSVEKVKEYRKDEFTQQQAA